MNEQISTYSKIMIEELLNMYALASMARSSDNYEYIKTASEWMPRIESSIQGLKREFESIKEREVSNI